MIFGNLESPPFQIHSLCWIFCALWNYDDHMMIIVCSYDGDDTLPGLYPHRKYKISGYVTMRDGRTTKQLKIDLLSLWKGRLSFAKKERYVYVWQMHKPTYSSYWTIFFHQKNLKKSTNEHLDIVKRHLPLVNHHLLWQMDNLWDHRLFIVIDITMITNSLTMIKEA